MFSKRPEKDTVNPPGQIRNPVPQAKYLRDVIKRIEKQERSLTFPNCRCQFEDQCVPACPKFHKA